MYRPRPDDGSISNNHETVSPQRRIIINWYQSSVSRRNEEKRVKAAELVILPGLGGFRKHEKRGADKLSSIIPIDALSNLRE